MHSVSLIRDSYRMIFNWDLDKIAAKLATAASLDFHKYTFKPYGEYFEQIESQESHLIMPQLAKNAPQTERVYLLLRGENRPNSTYKAPKFHANSRPNIAKLDFNIMAKWLHSKIASMVFW